jgi:hypothetical protein
MKPLTGRARVRAELDAHPALTDDQLARRLLRALAVTGVAAKVLAPLLADVFGFERRHDTRAEEAAVFNGVSLRSAHSEPTTITLTVQLLRAPLPELRDVTWGSATRAQMVEAKQRLLARAAGIQLTVVRLEKAIALLDETGALSLSEVPDLADRL